jgi:hypothetical protein
MTEYAVFYFTGSCGSFIQRIFVYYQQLKENKDNKNLLIIDKDTGHCHPQLNYNYQHWSHDDMRQVDDNTKVILISYDNDDMNVISNMGYFKWIKPTWLDKQKELAIQTWPKLESVIDDPVQAKQVQKEITITGMTNWIKDVDLNLVDFVIKFKTIIGKSNEDLNQLIADYVGVTKSSVVDEYINEYRLINQKIYGTS